MSDEKDIDKILEDAEDNKKEETECEDSYLDECKERNK